MHASPLHRAHLRQRRPPSTTLIPPSHLPTNPLAYLRHLPQVHPRLHTQPLQKIHQILRRHIPRGPRAKRTTTEPAHRAIKDTDAVFKSNKGIDQSLAVRVVEVQRQILVFDAGGRQRAQEGLGARGRAHARGICDGDLLGAHLEEGGADFGHAVGVDVGAFVGAAERDGDVGAGGEVVGLRFGDEGAEAGEGFGYGAVCVSLGEGFGRGEEEGEFVVGRVGGGGRAGHGVGVGAGGVEGGGGVVVLKGGGVVVGVGVEEVGETFAVREEPLVGYWLGGGRWGREEVGEDGGGVGHLRSLC